MDSYLQKPQLIQTKSEIYSVVKVVINGEIIVVSIIIACEKPKHFFPGAVPPDPRRCSLVPFRWARFARKMRYS